MEKHQVHIENTKEQTMAAAAITPEPVNYATLEADVAAHAASWVERLREEHGEEVSAQTVAMLKANPWVALQWYVEDCMPTAQRNADIAPPAHDPQGLSAGPMPADLGGVVEALETIASPEASLTDSEEMAELVDRIADQSPDLKGLEHLAKCMSWLMAQGDFYPRAPREFEQAVWDKAQGEAFMEDVTREDHAEAFREFFAKIGYRVFQ